MDLSSLDWVKYAAGMGRDVVGARRDAPISRVTSHYDIMLTQWLSAHHNGSLLC